MTFFGVVDRIRFGRIRERLIITFTALVDWCVCFKYLPCNCVLIVV